MNGLTVLVVWVPIVVLLAQPLAGADDNAPTAVGRQVPHATPRSPSPQVTDQAVRKGIVGMWNCTGTPCEGAVIAFDAAGRITQEGFLSENGQVLGFESTSRYQLSANPKGAGIRIMRVLQSGKAVPMYLVEAIDGDTVSMRTLEGSPHYSSGATTAVKWKRADHRLDAPDVTPQVAPKADDTSPTAVRARAEGGSAADQFILGGSYAWGQDGLPEDNVQAYKWMSLAAQRGSGETREFYAANLEMVALKMTPEQIAEGKKLAREWTAAFEKRRNQ